MIDLTNVLSNVSPNFEDFAVVLKNGIRLYPHISLDIHEKLHQNPCVSLYGFVFKSHLYHESQNNVIGEFEVKTDVVLTPQMKAIFINDDGSFKIHPIHPIHFLFSHGIKGIQALTCPSMGISVSDDVDSSGVSLYQSNNLARIVIQLALYAFEILTDNAILTRYFGGSLNTQILAIDGDGSGGFWEAMGMAEHRAGYDYNGRIAYRCGGMEMTIDYMKMRRWAVGNRFNAREMENMNPKIYEPLLGYFMRH